MKLFLLILCVSIHCIGSSAVIEKSSTQRKSSTITSITSSVIFWKWWFFKFQSIYRKNRCNNNPNNQFCAGVFRSVWTFNQATSNWLSPENTQKKVANLINVHCFDTIEEFEANCETDLFRNNNDFAGKKRLKNVRCVVLPEFRSKVILLWI